VFKTVDAGASWTAVNTTLTNLVVAALAIDPATPTTVYAGTDGGVFKSVDGGGSWSPLTTGLTTLEVVGLAIDPVTPTTVYAGTNGGGAFQIRQLAIPTSLGLGLGLDAATYRAGDRLVVALTAANPGPAGFVDVFFGVLFPPAVGPALGCPGGDAVAFITFAQVVLTCLSAPPAGFPALLREVSVPGAMPLITFPTSFSVVLPALPTGTYVVFIAATSPEALLDGTIDPGDLVAIASAAFGFVP
jgi:hypothetical protein